MQPTHRGGVFAWRGFTLTEIMIVVTIIGLLLSLIVPALQRVQRSSQDKAVFNNARQLAAAADQYFLETGAATVDLANLTGTTNYVKSLRTIANETYPAAFTQGVAVTVTGIAGARTITFAP